MIEIGYYSLPVVGLTAIFTGMVLALQSYTGFARFDAESAIANVVVLSITRELGPVLAGLMVAGRIGAAMAAEIGTMRVTEQIDALTTLSTNPFKYLVAPRLIAGVADAAAPGAASPTSSACSAAISSASTSSASIPATYLRRHAATSWRRSDVVSGLVKAAVFGFIIALMGCYHGYQLARRRAGRRRGDDQRRGLGLDPDPHLQLRHHRAVLRAMSTSRPPKIERPRPRQSRSARSACCDGVDLDVGAGESLVVIGGSGTGKSVLIKCILGLLAARRRLDPDRRRGGRRPARPRRASACMRKFGMLFQGAALFDSPAGLGECRLRPDRRGAAWRATQAKEIALAQARPRSASAPRSASCGRPSSPAACRSASALARAIAAEPEIIFFDEPTTGLDPIMADVINDLIVECVQRPGRHRALDHPRHGERAQDRRPHRHALRRPIIWAGPADEIDRSGNAYVDQFIHGRAEGPIKMPVRPL